MTAEPDTAPSSNSVASLLVGPANFAGQGRAIAEAARSIPGVEATSFAVDTGSVLTLPAHVQATAEEFADPEWTTKHQEWVLDHSHVLLEGGRQLSGPDRRDAGQDILRLKARGVAIGMLAHGSDVRHPDRHSELFPHSPFKDMEPDFVAARQAYANRWARTFADYDHTFVTTPDLLDDVPSARWIPSVVDTQRWAAPRTPHEGPLRVLHTPSSARYKGTELIDPILARLEVEGLVEYVRPEQVAQQDMPAVVAGADLVLEQFTLGIYSVAAIEAMATGRAVLAHVHPRVRAHIAAVTGREVPVIEADASTLEEVLRDLIAHPETLDDAAEAGQAYALDVHDGRVTAEVLRPFLGVA